MQHHTQPPYHLTLKSNGCLILISALSPSHLVVASKHSLGTTTEAQAALESEADAKLVDGVGKLDLKGDKGKGKAAVQDDEHIEAMQHAEVGRMWLKRTLQRSGRTEEELARRLWDESLTAVLEVSSWSLLRPFYCSLIWPAVRRFFRGACHCNSSSLDGATSTWTQQQHPPFQHATS